MMRARTTILLALAPLGLTACQKKPPEAQDQNISITQPVTNETMANADIEMLPPDESSATPTNELASGSDNPDVNDLNALGNSH